MSDDRPFIIDAVAHAFDNRMENCIGGRYAERVMESFYDMQKIHSPDPYNLSRERYFQPMTAEALASVLFVESPTDVAVYHPVPLRGVFRDFSPIEVGLEIRDRYPGRMMVYGGISPFDGAQALEDLERQVEEWGILGVKMYPIAIVDGKLRTYSMGDEKLVYPLLERCQELGIRMVAMHKAVPNGEVQLDPFRPDDVSYAARDFPDLNFEVVHAGFAFLEETALQMASFENVYLNMEATAQLVFNRPERFAEILGEIMVLAGHENLFWGTGAAFFHPEPVLKAFMDFQIPEALVSGRGYPELTDEVKADILGRNYARAHGLDIDALKAQIADDELAQQRARGDREPFELVPDPAVAA